MEHLIHLVCEYLTDSRNVKLTCSSWNDALETHGQEIIGTILASKPQFTLHENTVLFVARNNIHMVNKIVQMSHKPILWNHLAFYVKSRRMLHLIRGRISTRYYYVGLCQLLNETEKSFIRFSHLDPFSIFNVGRKHQSFIHSLIKGEMQITGDNAHMIPDNRVGRELIGFFGSPEYRESLRFPPRCRNICDVILSHEYPYDLPTTWNRKSGEMDPFLQDFTTTCDLPDSLRERVAILLKYGRIDHLDILISKGEIEIKDISLIMDEYGLSFTPSLWTYIVRVTPYY